MQEYNQYLSGTQKGYRDFFKEFNFNLFLTITYPFKVSEKRIRADINLLQRHIAKATKSQIVYFGFYVTTDKSSHAHILLKSKKVIDEIDLFFLDHDCENFNFIKNNRFPFRFKYKLDILDTNLDLERVCQYLVRKVHMVKESDLTFEHLIQSNPKKLRKSRRWSYFLF
jgi:hypothetical protein